MSEERKKDREENGPVDTAFDEALMRLTHSDPNDIKDAFAQSKKDEEEAKKYVEERRESIRKGARRAPKRFRL